jgi:hypothetical protein
MGCCQGKSAKNISDAPAVAVVENKNMPTTPQKEHMPKKGMHSKTDSMIERDIDEFMGVDNSAKRKRRKEKKKLQEAAAIAAAAGCIEMTTVGSKKTSDGFETLNETKEDAAAAAAPSRKGGEGESNIAAMQQQVVVATGWLLKKGQGKGMLARRNWKKRYFVLERKRFRYFTKCSAEGEGLGLKGELTITSSSMLPIRKVDGAKYDFRFDLIQRHPVTRLICLRAETEVEEKKWIAAVKSL